MNAKKIEKIAKAYEKIKVLDAEILKLDKMAMKLADGIGELSINITFDEPKESEVKFDEDGSIVMDNPLSGFASGGFLSHMLELRREIEKRSEDEGYSEKLDENKALNLLGLLISSKMQQRSELIKSIDL